AELEQERASRSLAAATAKAWFTATQLGIHADIATRMLDSARRLQGFAVDRQRVGAGTEAETAIARATQNQYEDALQQLLFARGQALRALELLVGRYPA